MLIFRDYLVTFRPTLLEARPRPRLLPLGLIALVLVASPGCEQARGAAANGVAQTDKLTLDDAPAAPQPKPSSDSLSADSKAHPAPSDAAPSDATSANSASTGAPQRNNNPPTDAARLYAKTRYVWIRSMPQSDVQWIGYLWWGGSVKIRNEKPVPGAGCSKVWVPVEPRGWVCADDKQATLNPEDPELLAIYPYRPDLDSPWPHNYAATHSSLTKFATLPSELAQKQQERGYEAHFAEVKKARLAGNIENFPDYLGKLDPSLSGKPAPVLGQLPSGLQENQSKLVDRSAISFIDQFDVEDRSFLLTGDLGWVPKDRVELLERSQFMGVVLGEDVQLPLAFFRGHARPAFVRKGPGEFSEQPETFARHAHVQLSGEVEQVQRIKYYKVQGQELWVSDKEAVIPTPKDKTPWGAPVGQADTTGLARPGRSTWIEASILGGWLVAFEGTRPVYATMISAGRGGGPVGARDPLETASTPTGRFAIGGKFKTATMESSSSPILHADVPWTQNFSGPHAIHSAYWHDDFGNLKSAGCVNVSPRDGKWLFEFTEPEVPTDWHGVRYMARYGAGSTLFVIHE